MLLLLLLLAYTGLYFTYINAGLQLHKHTTQEYTFGLNIGGNIGEQRAGATKLVLELHSWYA